MIDYEAVLYDPIYSAFGTPASLTTVDGTIAELTVIDKTAGVLIDEGNGLSFATTKPAACVRISELAAADLTRSGIKRAAISFNGSDWEITATQPKPNPSGAGELYLILEEASDG